MLQLMNPIKIELIGISVELEELFKLLPSKGKTLRHRPKELHNLRQMVIGLSILLVLALSRLKQEVSCNELKYHTGKAPEVG
jgi:hypothetical protein